MHDQTQDRQARGHHASATGQVDRGSQVDCHDEDEQTSGFFNMIEDALAVPFVTRILGVEVSRGRRRNGRGRDLKAVCEHGGERQRIVLLDLPLTPQLPAGAQWIAAYRRWVQGQ